MLKFYDPDKVREFNDEGEDIKETILEVDKTALKVLPCLYITFIFFYFLDYANEVEQF